MVPAWSHKPENPGSNPGSATNKVLLDRNLRGSETDRAVETFSSLSLEAHNLQIQGSTPWPATK